MEGGAAGRREVVIQCAPSWRTADGAGVGLGVVGSVLDEMSSTVANAGAELLEAELWGFAVRGVVDSRDVGWRS